MQPITARTTNQPTNMEYQLYSLAEKHMTFVSSHSSVAEAVQAAKTAELQINNFLVFNVCGGWPVFATQAQIVKEYDGGAYSIQTSGKLVGTVYKPDGTEYRAALTESLDELCAHDYPRQ